MPLRETRNGRAAATWKIECVMQLLRVEKVLSWVCPGFLSHWQARECESTLVESAGVRVYTESPLMK